MKRKEILIAVTALALILATTACGGNKPVETSETSTTETTIETTIETSETIAQTTVTPTVTPTPTPTRATEPTATSAEPTATTNSNNSGNSGSSNSGSSNSGNSGNSGNSNTPAPTQPTAAPTQPQPTAAPTQPQPTETQAPAPTEPAPTQHTHNYVAVRTWTESDTVTCYYSDGISFGQDYNAALEYSNAHGSSIATSTEEVNVVTYTYYECSCGANYVQ